MRRHNPPLLLLLAALLIALPAFGQDEPEEAPQFVSDLAALLERGEFNGQEIAAFVRAAQDLDWDDAEGADPALVALALEQNADEENGLEPLEEARLALELALTTLEMENAGYDDRVVARAAVEGSREVVRQIQAWKQEGSTENLGHRIRETVRTRVRSAIDSREAQERADRARNRGPGAPDRPDDRTGVPGSPPDAPGRF